MTSATAPMRATADRAASRENAGPLIARSPRSRRVGIAVQQRRNIDHEPAGEHALLVALARQRRRQQRTEDDAHRAALRPAPVARKDLERTANRRRKDWDARRGRKRDDAGLGRSRPTTARYA